MEIFKKIVQLSEYFHRSALREGTNAALHATDTRILKTLVALAGRDATDGAAQFMGRIAARRLLLFDQSPETIELISRAFPYDESIRQAISSALKRGARDPR